MSLLNQRQNHINPVFVLNLAELVHIMSPLEFCAFGASQTFRRVEYQGTADTYCVYLVCSYLSSVVTSDFAYRTQDANGRALTKLRALLSTRSCLTAKVTLL